jgi:ribosome-binding protein aMBF1 (putative translation factor)
VHTLVIGLLERKLDSWAGVVGRRIAKLLYSNIAMAEPGESVQPKRRLRTLERVRERLAHAEEGWFFAQIAEQVTAQRHARGLSQAELAELCSTTQSAIARLEAGERPPRIDTLLRIANALDCNLAVELRPRTIPRGGPS